VENRIPLGGGSVKEFAPEGARSPFPPAAEIGHDRSGTMETPPVDPDPPAGPPTEEWEQPLGTVRAQAAPRELPPRAPNPRPRRVGGPLLAIALVAVLGAGGFLAWHFAKGSDRGGGGLGAITGSASSNNSTKGSSSPGGGSATTASRTTTNAAASPTRRTASPTTKTASPGTTSGAASPTNGAASPGAERSAVVAISSVLAFAGRGRSAAQHGDWATALQNRQATLARLGSVHAVASVKAPLGFLAAALQASIKADQQRVKCGCGAENAQDIAATTLKQRFLAGFNPLATRYLKRTYTEPDI
jgi:hypothetical protein